jgi:hypothetical protein
MRNELRGVDEGTKTMNCFNNTSCGERLADLAWDLTRRNFTETLMRRSYITWFWTITDAKGNLVNSPLNTDVWNKLLPSVHQNSKDANLGYIKGVLDEFQAWLKDHPKANVVEREAKRRELSIKALTVEGAFGNNAPNQDPEVDTDDKREITEIQAQIIEGKKEEAAKVSELRRSSRISGKPAEPVLPPKPAPPKPAPPQEQEEEEQEQPKAPKAKAPAKPKALPVPEPKVEVKAPKPKAVAKAKPKAVVKAVKPAPPVVPAPVQKEGGRARKAPRKYEGFAA